MKKILAYFSLSPVFYLLALPGLEYTYLESPSSSYLSSVFGQQSVHIIEIDPDIYEIKPVKALDNGIGREDVLSISNRHEAVASINGGFFSIGGTLDGRACGALKIHDWYAFPLKPRGCIGWSAKDQNPQIDRLLVKVVANDDLKTISIHGLNRARKEGEIILFTPCFHRTTLTNPDGEEVVVVDGMIQSVVKGGSTKIPENGYVLSIQKTNPLFSSFALGTPLTFTIQIDPLMGLSSVEEWEKMNYIVGGTPVLMHHGAKVMDFESEQTLPTFLSNKHARTAVGILPNGHWLFVVVDKNGIFDGMTMEELSDLMKKLGCVQALNLDGGGSSTMVHEGVIKNTPRGDEDEGAGQKMVRRVSDAIIVRSKK